MKLKKHTVVEAKLRINKF